MNKKVDLAKSNLVNQICSDIQIVMMGLVSSFYRSITSISAQLPRFRVIEKNLNLGELGILDILAADHRRTLFIIHIEEGEITIQTISSLIYLCGILRSYLMDVLKERLLNIQKELVSHDNQTNINELIAIFEEDMVDSWHATSVIPVVIGSNITDDALSFVYSLNSIYAAEQAAVVPTPLVFCGIYKEASDSNIGVRVQDVLKELSICHTLPYGEGMNVVRNYAEGTCDKMIRDFMDYEQQKKAHTSKYNKNI